MTEAPVPTNMIQRIRLALVEQIDAELPDVQCSPYILSDPTPPALHVAPGEIEYDLAFGRGMDSMMFTLTAFVALPNDIAGQMLLDELMAPAGPTSIKRAVEPDRAHMDLGGLVYSARVVSCGGYRRFNLANIGEVLGADWTVEVKANGGTFNV